jgi:DNA mismatch repair protein MSH6
VGQLLANDIYILQLYGEFSKDYPEWLRGVKIISELDCLVSLAKSSSAFGEPAVRPEIVEEAQAAVQFEELRHPCVFSAASEFIPNSVSLGGAEKNMVLLTGPNVGSLLSDCLTARC